MKKKYIITVLLMSISLVILFSGSIFAEEINFEEPVFVTSVGQSADVQMARAIVARIQLEHQFDQVAWADEILKSNPKTILAVVGGSSKGLGSAGLDEEEEMERSKEIIEKAKENDIKIIGLHLGGAARRGTISDPFIELVFNEADYLLVYDDGDEDGMMAEIAQEKEIELVYVERVAEIEEPLRRLFNIED